MPAMTLKIHAGDWGDTIAGFGPGWTGKYRIVFSRGFFKGKDTYFIETDIAELEIVTEENKKRSGTGTTPVLLAEDGSKEVLIVVHLEKRGLSPFRTQPRS